MSVPPLASAIFLKQNGMTEDIEKKQTAHHFR